MLSTRSVTTPIRSSRILEEAFADPPSGDGEPATDAEVYDARLIAFQPGMSLRGAGEGRQESHSGALSIKTMLGGEQRNAAHHRAHRRSIGRPCSLSVDDAPVTLTACAERRRDRSAWRGGSVPVWRPVRRR